MKVQEKAYEDLKNVFVEQHREVQKRQEVKIIHAHFITKTCPCNIDIFSALKLKTLLEKIYIFFKYFFKTLIVGTR